jgi:hypothetical protein
VLFFIHWVRGQAQRGRCTFTSAPRIACSALALGSTDTQTTTVTPPARRCTRLPYFEFRIRFLVLSATPFLQGISQSIFNSCLKQDSVLSMPFGLARNFDMCTLEVWNSTKKNPQKCTGLRVIATVSSFWQHPPSWPLSVCCELFDSDSSSRQQIDNNNNQSESVTVTAVRTEQVRGSLWKLPLTSSLVEYRLFASLSLRCTNN